MLYIYTCLIVRLHVTEVKATCLDTTPTTLICSMKNTNTALGIMEHHITAYEPCISTYAVITEGYCLCFACEL